MSDPRFGDTITGTSVSIISRGLMSLEATRHVPFYNNSNIHIDIMNCNLNYPNLSMLHLSKTLFSLTHYCQCIKVFIYNHKNCLDFVFSFYICMKEYMWYQILLDFNRQEQTDGLEVIKIVL